MDPQNISADENAAGAGSYSLAGYGYQIDVSVWLALDLVVISRLTDGLILEPASQEDLEATLADIEPDRTVGRAQMDGYTLIVQVKRRGGSAWTPKTLNSLLRHGSETRLSGAARLEEKSARYLLVTSAGLNVHARKLGVRRAAVWPKPTVKPKGLETEIKHDISGRVAVIANQDDERLTRDINEALLEGCRVPTSQISKCRKVLHEAARTRIVSAGNTRWQREEIEAIIREHGGYLASAPELENYVYPNNWRDLRAMMAHKSAAVIIGQSGTGKTLATKKLYDELRLEITGLNRVPIRRGPIEYRDDVTLAPVLYDIEDPWGRYDFDLNSRPWNDQLNTILATARPDKMIVVTSRFDVAQESGALGSVEPWVVKLEAENYGQRERQALYHARVNSLPRAIQSFAQRSRDQVLEELKTPLEIQKFFDALRFVEVEPKQNLSKVIAGAIKNAHQNSIERTVIEQIDGREDIRAAAVIYALMVANDKIPLSTLRQLEDGLADQDPVMEKGVSPLAHFLVAARNLRQSDAGLITYYHPRVEAGIERALEREVHSAIVRRTLQRLIALLTSDAALGDDWGSGAAARMLPRLREKFGVTPGAAATLRIDSWLESQFVEAGGVGVKFELAALAGSPASNAAELARFLYHRPESSFHGFKNWGAPDRSHSWYQARAADPSTKPLLEAFIKYVLPRDGVSYPSNFAKELKRLATDLTPAFMEVALEVVSDGYIAADDAIGYGALDDLNGFESVVDRAVTVLTPSQQERESADELALDILNGRYSEDYAQFLVEDDRGFTASEFLKMYVERVRSEGDWGRIAGHRHAYKLRFYWVRQLSRRLVDELPEKAEIACAFLMAHGTPEEEYMWLALLEAWAPSYREQLETRILVGDSEPDVQRAAMRCVVKHLPESLIAIAGSLFENGKHNRLIEIALLLGGLRDRGSGGESIADANIASKCLPPPFHEICDAQLAIAREKDVTLSVAAQQLLVTIDVPSDAVRAFRLEVDRHISMASEQDVRWALTICDDHDVTIAGIKAAIRHNMTPEIEAALDHRYADVVARALTNLASRSEAPLPRRLLEVDARPFSPIRLALAKALKAKPHQSHKFTLIRLVRDDWSEHSHSGTDNSICPTARIAIAALDDIAPLEDEDNAALLSIGLASDDSVVRGNALMLVTKAGSPMMQRRVFDIAVESGLGRVRRSAALALLQAGEHLDQSVIDAITPEFLSNRFQPVACVFAVLLGARGRIDAVKSAAEKLSTNKKRRVLLLLVVRALVDRDRSVAEAISALLPVGHPGVTWALGGALDTPADDNMIADLGDHTTCAEVLDYMQP